jgi:hypothetical protein
MSRILYELINPSDPYTFYAPSIEIAGVAACMISPSYGAKPVANEGESSPVLFGWAEWFREHGINSQWVATHADEIAEALDSLLIGGSGARADVEALLDALPEEEQADWIRQRQARERSSMNDIGGRAYALAANLRKKAA